MEWLKVLPEILKTLPEIIKAAGTSDRSLFALALCLILISAVVLLARTPTWGRIVGFVGMVVAALLLTGASVNTVARSTKVTKEYLFAGPFEISTPRDWGEMAVLSEIKSDKEWAGVLTESNGWTSRQMLRMSPRRSFRLT